MEFRVTQPKCARCGKPHAAAPTKVSLHPADMWLVLTKVLGLAKSQPSAPPDLGSAIKTARAETAAEGSQARADRLTGHFKVSTISAAPTSSARASKPAPVAPDLATVLRKEK